MSGLVGDLVQAVEELQSELDSGGRSPLRPPTPRELARFTSEVTIPAIVLALETNVRVLKLLQRTLRLASGADPGTSSTTGARERAEAAGRSTLSRLDDLLADLQSALEKRPSDDPARELLDEAQSLRVELDDRLAAAGGDNEGEQARPGGGDGSTSGDGTEVDVDIESELRSIKDDVDGDDDGDESSDGKSR
jgi:hypothetical protein